MRDRFAHRLCNFVMDHVATEEYRMRLKMTILLGLSELDRINDMERNARS